MCVRAGTAQPAEAKREPKEAAADATRDEERDRGNGGRETVPSPAKVASNKHRKIDPSAVEIGASREKIDYVDNAEHFGMNGVLVSKPAMAIACNCGPNEKCWAIPMSVLGWPLALRVCPTPEAPGHESHDAKAHQFTEAQMATVQTMYKAAAQMVHSGA